MPRAAAPQIDARIGHRRPIHRDEIAFGADRSPLAGIELQFRAGLAGPQRLQHHPGGRVGGVTGAGMKSGWRDEADPKPAILRRDDRDRSTISCRWRHSWCRTAAGSGALGATTKAGLPRNGSVANVTICWIGTSKFVTSNDCGRSRRRDAGGRLSHLRAICVPCRSAARRYGCPAAALTSRGWQAGDKGSIACHPVHI